MNHVKLVDAGFSTQLANYVDEPIDGHPLWSARFLITHKDKCVAVHRDFIRAGAEIIRTGSYQASVDGYIEHMQLSHHDATLAITESVSFVKRAIQMEEEIAGRCKEILIAGSVGPFGASLHDGSEYTGSYADKVSCKQMMEWHRPRVEALIEGGPDLLAMETIPCIKEATALITLLKEYPHIRAWISFSVKDATYISSGESFMEAAKKCWSLGSDQLVAIGVNCLSPVLVTPLFSRIIRSNPAIPLIACPNSGEIYDVEHKRWNQKETPKSVADYVEEWLNLGTTYIGGCCRTSADDTYQMSQHMYRWRNKIV